ncbi:MAG: hypothetical protein P8Y78_13365, partial [Acidihalobacter sp.]
MTAPSLPRDARWVLLPIENYSQTPQAGSRAEAIARTLLARRGLKMANYQQPKGNGGLPVLDEQRRYQQAYDWAKAQGFRYAVTGSVEEWHYKSGLDGEPAVGLSLRVIDVQSGATLWSASGAKTGWGYQSAAGTAIKLMNGLLGGLRLH